MPETTNHKIRYPSTSDPNAYVASYKNIAEDTERELDKIDPKQIVGGAAGKILIAKSTGAGVWAALKGDATLAEDGTLTIANDAITAPKIAENAVGASKIAANAVGESEVADGAVTSRKAKLTSGILTLSEQKTLGETLEDMPGMKLEITPAVASILKVTLVACIMMNGTSPVARAGIGVDGVDQEDYAELSMAGGTWASCAMVYRIPLTAALHTIKVRARRQVTTEAKLLVAKAIAGGGGTKMLWELSAS